jgi:hypothetical protein
MKDTDFKISQSDKIEIVKQQQKKQNLVLLNKIQPQKNHKLFECDTIKKTISLAKFQPPRTDLHYNEAIDFVNKKIDLNNHKTVTKSKVLINPNCIYISALNSKNVIKILNRDYNLSGFVLA